MLPEIVTDREATVAERLSEFLRQPVNSALLEVATHLVDDLERETWEVIEARRLATTTGVWLDYLGWLVSEPRLARDDTQYRRGIIARTKVLRSRGRSEDLISLLGFWNVNYSYLDYGSLCWEATLPPQGTALAFILRYLAQAKAVCSTGSVAILSSPAVAGDLYSDAGNPILDIHVWGDIVP